MGLPEATKNFSRRRHASPLALQQAETSSFGGADI